MKKLKKILLAVLILALIATAVVVTVLADDSGEEGVATEVTVTEAQALLDAVSEKTTYEQKSTQLKAVYAYIFNEANPLDPYSEGYDELLTAYSDATLAVAQGLLADYAAATSAATKEAKLIAAYSHYKGAPIAPDYESLNPDGYEAWQTFRLEYTTEAVKVLSSYLLPVRSAETLDERHAALKTASSKFSTRALYFAYDTNDRDIATEIPGLTDFVHEYNRWCMSVLSDYVDAVTSPKEMTAARKKYVSPDHVFSTDPTYFNSVYLATVEKLDLNIIKYANELLDNVTVTPENYRTEALDAINAVYSYLDSTRCILRKELADTVGVSHEELQKRVNGLTYEITQYFYAEVEAFVGEDGGVYSESVYNFIDFVKSCPAIIFRPAVNTGVYNGEISVAEELLAGVKDAELSYLDSYMALCAYLYESAIDPDVEGAAEFYSAFDALKLEISDFVVVYLNDLVPAPTVAGGEEIDEEAFSAELEKLGKIANFLNNASVSSDAINKYNETAEAFLETIEKLWCRNIEYSEPEIGAATGELNEALALFEAIDLSSDDALEAYAALYEYLVKTPVDFSVEGAEEFYDAFSALTLDLADALASEIYALITRPAYIDIFAFDCPELAYRDPVVESLNGTVEDATLLLDEVNSLLDSESELAEIFAAYEKFYIYNYKTGVDSSLSGAYLYHSKSDALTASVSALVVETLLELDAAPVTEDADGEEILDLDALKENAAVFASIGIFLKECPVTPEAIEAYNALRGEFFASIKSSYGDEFDTERFEADLAKLNEIALYLEKVCMTEDLVSLYNAKASDMKLGVQALKCPVAEEKVFESKNLEGSLLEATVLLVAVEDSAKARLSAYSELYNYLRENAISPDEESYSDFYSEYASLTASISAEILAKLGKLNFNPLYFEVEYPEIIYSAIEPLTYGGNLSDATALLNKLKYAIGDVNPDIDEIMAAYLELSEYVQRNAVPKDAVGADKFYLGFEKAKLDVTELILGEFKAPTTLFNVNTSYKKTGSYDEAIAYVENAIIAEYAKLYSYMANYGVNTGAANLKEAKNAAEVMVNFKALTAKVSNIVTTRISAIESLSDQKEMKAQLDFWNKVLVAAPISETVVGAYNSAVASYNTKFGANLGTISANISFDKKDGSAAAAISLYDGVITAAENAILDAYNAIGESEKSAFLLELREYLEENSISTEIIIKYNELAVGYELSVNEKLLSFIRDTRISAKAVEAYNAVIADLKASVGENFIPDADGIAASLKDIKGIAEFLTASPISMDLVNVYNGVLNSYIKTLKKALDASYYDFLAVNSEFQSYLAIVTETLEALGMTAFPEDIDYEAFLEGVGALDAFVMVKDITDYIYSDNKDEAGKKLPTVDEFREDFAKTLNDVIAADLLVYIPENGNTIYSGVINEVQAIIDRYYAAVDADAKAEIYKELFDYMSDNAMNPKLNGYEDVMASFDAIGEEVYKSFIEKINASADKTAAMAEMRAYLEEYPISSVAIEAYNMMYLKTYSAQLSETHEKFSEVLAKLHEFIEGFEGSDELIDSFEGLSSAIDNYETLEILALVQFYEMKMLDEDPNSNTVSVTARGGAVKVLNNYVRKYPISEDSYAYAATMADVNGISDAYKQLVEDARAALDDKTPLEDYENDTFSYIVNNDNGTGLGFTHADPSVGTMVEYFPDTARGGMYARYSYGSNTKNAFLGRAGLPGTVGFVLEFDLTGDNGVTYFSFNRLDRTTGSAVQQNMFSITNNCFNYNGPNAAQWKNKEVITPGEWTKFIFVYDPVNITLTGYIDYEYVDTWSVRYAANPNDPLIEVRFSGAKVNTSFNIDNFMIYSGSNYRILDKYESMTDADEFEYFVNYMNDETRAPTSRLQAYQKATLLLEAIKNDAALAEQLKDVIEKYNTTDVEKNIIAPAKDANLVKIKEYGDRLNAYEGNVTSQNYATVQLLIDELEKFIADNSEYIDKSSDSYKDVSASISRFKSLLDRCNNVTSFVKALQNFRNSTTLAAKNKYYATTVQYFELAQLYREDIRLEVMSDPAILEFEALLNLGLTPMDDEYVDIFTYYENCGKEIGIQQNKENSKRIIDCLNFIKSLDGYENTEEFWQANFDYINKYTTIIRDVVNKNAYDASYEGVEEAISEFRVIDVYFYAALQEDHIAFISEQLDKYASSASYIEKLGICTYVSNYIEANDIDLDNETLAALVLKNETYLIELEIYREDYITVLEQNTVKFVNIVEEMKTQVGYKALSELYAEALKYYYEMNITEASQAAIAVFESYAETIRTMEENSALFIGYANAVSKARNDAALFKALVNAKAYRDLASEDIEGVSDAIEIYDEAFENYNAEIDDINSGIAEVNGVVTVTRTNNIASAVMSVINNILNK